MRVLLVAAFLLGSSGSPLHAAIPSAVGAKGRAARTAAAETATERCPVDDHTVEGLEWVASVPPSAVISATTPSECSQHCCQTNGCAVWSYVRTDKGAHLCKGWGTDVAQTLQPRAAAISGRVDGMLCPGRRCPVEHTDWPAAPKWVPNYNMAMSTVMMPCNTSGWFDPNLAAKYGIADFDWSTGRSMWANSHPMSTNHMLIQQIAKVKAVNPNTHTWVYRNLVKALAWYEDVSSKLNDPAYQGWFLRFDPQKRNLSSPPCTEGVCSSAYHSQDQTPQHLTGRKECHTKCDCGPNVPCGEYLWDHRNASLRKWLVQEHVMGAHGMGNENVSGFYFDDWWAESGDNWYNGPLGLPPRNQNDINLSNSGTGPSEMESHCLEDMGLSKQDVLDLNDGWRKTSAEAMLAVVNAGGWVWQMFAPSGWGGGTPIGLNATGPSCATALRESCKPNSMQQTHMTLSMLTPIQSPSSFKDPRSDVARFLLTRGDFAYLGTGWVGCLPNDGVESAGINQTYDRPAELDVDYGTPLSLCTETEQGSNVFVREWTKARVQHDCNTGNSQIVMK